jgi:hypothetical protein
MIDRLKTLRAVAVLAVTGALTLAGCGGGGGSVSPLPSSNTGTTTTTTPTLPQTVAGAPAGYLSLTVPNQVSGVSAQGAQRAIFSAARKPTFIDTTTANSALVVSVTPFDPSEAAQYGNLTVCYNLYTGGTLAAKAPPNFTYTNAGNTVTTVTLAIPAPPGTDSFQITQYAGQCGSSPYTLPTPPPGSLGTTGILSQTPATLAYMNPGVANNLNAQIGGCPLQTNPCPSLAGAPATLVSSIAVAGIAFGGSGNSTSGALPIAAPVREQANFLLPAATKFIGIPIPLEGLNAAGVVIPGSNTPGAGNVGAGPIPQGVTVTWSDNSAHTKMYLVDATNGAIAQIAPNNTTGIKIHEFNALSTNTTLGLVNQCDLPALTSTCNDNTAGGGVAGDPWVIVLTFDGTDASIISSITVTATTTINGTAQTITTTVTPQSAVYTAAGTGYADVAAPAAPLNMLQQGANVFFTDGNTVKLDGTATVSSAVGTKLAGLAYATWPSPTVQTNKFIYATDNGQASGSVVPETASGVYSWVAPGLTGPLPVAAQAGAGNYLKFNKPLGVCEAIGSDGAYYLYVIDSTGAIFQLDIGNLGANDGNGFQIASNTQQLTTTGTALSPGTVTASSFLGTAPIGGTGATGFLVADPGNNRIAMVNTTASPAVITTYASGQPFTGIYLTGTAVYATTTSGQIYYISGSGATPVSFGLTTGATADGPVGPIASLTPTANLTPTPTVYALQGKGGAFFDNTTNFTPLVGAAYSALAAPYTVAQFPGSKVFAAAPAAGVGLSNNTNAAAITGAGKVQATGGLVVFPAGTAAAATVTPDSILFVDGGTKLRTLVR